VSAATQIAVKDLRLRIRDRSAAIIGIFAPLALAFIFDLVFGSTFASTSLDLEFGLVDEDGSQISQSFSQVLEEIEADGILRVNRFGDPGAAEVAIEEGVLDAYFLVPAGLGEAVFGQREASIEVIGDVDAPTSTQIAISIAEQFGRGVSAGQLSVATSAALSPLPPTPQQVAALSRAAAASARSFQLGDIPAATRQLDGPTYFAAGMAVFFLFFTVQFGVSGLLEEERDGTMARLLSAPIRRSSVVVGKAILSFALGIISMGVLVVATQLLIGASWGAPLGVTSLVVAGVLAAVAIMGLVAAVAKSPEGAGNLGSIIAVILGMLGGVFFPIGQGGDFLSRLTLLTPHAWFLRGLGDLADDAEWTAALPAAGAILSFAVVFGAAAWVLLRRRMRR
jgi:ABC-2 type transport system permease protein